MDTICEQSQLLGQFVGMVHILEAPMLDLDEKSFAEKHLPLFHQDPFTYFSMMQRKIVLLCQNYQLMHRKSVIHEIEVLYQSIDTETLPSLQLVQDHFLEGFRQQLAWGKIILG